MLVRDGFDIFQGDERVGAIKWGQVAKIVAFKRDMFAFDLVCLDFELSARNEVYEVNDDVGGFWDLVKEVKVVFPDSDQEWEEAVVKPAFARNEMVIYERSQSA